MRILHTMLRVGDLRRSVDFYTGVLGMQLLRTTDRPDQKYSLAFVGYGDESQGAVLELTYNWDPEVYTGGRTFGHLALGVDNIYAYCANLQKHGITINRPPRDGRMAFVFHGARSHAQGIEQVFGQTGLQNHGLAGLALLQHVVQQLLQTGLQGHDGQIAGLVHQALHDHAA